MVNVGHIPVSSVRRVSTAFFSVCLAVVLGLTAKLIFTEADQSSTFDTLPAIRPAVQIQQWTWFNQTQVVNKPVVVAQAKINAELLGVMIYGEQAIASISTRANPNGVYKVGDEVVNGVTITSIEKHRVVVTRGDELQQIQLNPVTKGTNSGNPLIQQPGLSDPPEVSPESMPKSSRPAFSPQYDPRQELGA